MSQPNDSRPQPSADGPTPEQVAPEGHSKPNGRYRYCAGQPVDPDQGVHPEMRADGAAATDGQGTDGQGIDGQDLHGHDNHSPSIPSSPAELIAMQDRSNNPRSEKPERQASAKVTQVMELIDSLDTKSAEDLAIAFRLVRRLEGFHDEVVDDMRNDAQASHHQLITWAIDADRLMQARILLGNVDLE